MEKVKIIACLGYRLGSDGEADPILKNRLNDVVLLAEKNPGSIVILMGNLPSLKLEKLRKRKLWQNI